MLSTVANPSDGAARGEGGAAMNRRPYDTPNQNKPRYLPTPAEIRAACLALHQDGERCGSARREDSERPPLELPTAPSRLYIG
jgi:hypothetical protein